MTRTIPAALVAAMILIASAVPARAQDLLAPARQPARQPVAALQTPALARAVSGIALTQVEPRRRDSVKNGTIIGAIIGGAAGAVGGWALAQIFEAEGANPVRPFVTITALGAGIGAGVGAGVDALVR